MRAKPMSNAKNIKMQPAFLCKKKIEKAKAEKNIACPEGKAELGSMKSA